jgi:hypothetical protein
MHYLDNALNATNLVSDLILPEASNDEVFNYQQLPVVVQWFLTGCAELFERHKASGLPALYAGELYALGCPP